MSEEPKAADEDLEPSPQAGERVADASHSPLIGRVVALVGEAEQALQALLAHEQAPSATTTDLIHDYRVALRRLRSVLRPLEVGYGKRKLRAFGDALREAAAITGDLRDEEVLRETLDDIEKGLDPRTLVALKSWKTGRERRERGQRARVIRTIRDDGGLHDGVSATLAAIRRRLLLPRKEAPPDGALSEEALRRAFEKAHVRIGAAKAAEPESMHRLRIAMKQLRYTIELMRQDSPLELAAAEAVAVKLQKQLGKLHDLDEALLRMDRARGLEPTARRAVLDELARVRHKLAGRCEREIQGTLRKVLAELGQAGGA